MRVITVVPLSPLRNSKRCSQVLHSFSHSRQSYTLSPRLIGWRGALNQRRRPARRSPIRSGGTEKASLRWDFSRSPGRVIGCGSASCATNLNVRTSPALAENTIRGHRSYMGNLKAFFGDRKLENITVSLVEAYRDERRQQPAKNKPGQTVKGATEC